MGKTDSKEPSPVLLTLGTHSYNNTTIDLAVALASSLNRQLHGLFVEDIDLIDAARLPFTRETTLATAQTLNFDSERLQRRLKNIGLRFRDQLASCAEKSNVVWRYTSVQGRTQDISLQETQETISEFLIIGQTVPYRTEISKRTKPQRILLVEDHSPNLDAALDVAINLAGNAALKVTLVKQEDRDTPFSQEALQEKHKKQIIDWKQINDQDFQQLLKTGALLFDIIIISRGTPAEDLQKILKKAACPVMIVS